MKMRQMNNRSKQRGLFYLGYYNYKIDGILGTEFKKSTRKFQEDYNLKVDGIFGKNTIDKMYSIWKNIQKKLNYYNKSVLKIDGLVGEKTIVQIKNFQKSNSLNITGICDKSVLKILYADDSKPEYPVKYVRITQGFKIKTHNGVDMGWDRRNERNEPSILAPLDMKIVYNSTGAFAGNYIVSLASYDEKNDILFRFLHLKNKPPLKIGNIILKGEPFATMGTTGNSTGIHLHFETWLVPKNYKYSFSDIYKYLKNPLEYVYVYPNQFIIQDKNYKLLTF